MSFEREKQTGMLLRFIGPKEYKRILKLEPGWEKTKEAHIYNVGKDSRGFIFYDGVSKSPETSSIDSIKKIIKKWKKVPFLYGSDINRYFNNIDKTSTVPIGPFYLYEVEPSSVPKPLLKEIEILYGEPSFVNTLKPKTREHFEQIFLNLD